MKVMQKDGSVLSLDGKEALSVLRHSCAHILAQAVGRLYPEAKFAYGSATEKGFYCDIDFGETKLGVGDLPAIEKEMETIVKENLPFKVFSLPKKDAAELMQSRGEIYKTEHIAELSDEMVSFYRQGEYIDMCIGPHITFTKAIKAFRLIGVSGAYWKNDADNVMLTRICGTAYFTKAELEQALKNEEEAQKRDHRKIGKEMQLFLLSGEGLGFPFFLPNGLIVKNALIDYWRELHRKHGYMEISTPIILNRSLWEQSGHWAHYRDTMYRLSIDGEEHCIKPMNCPGGILVYQSRPHSYKEFPLRVGELGIVHRNELRGTLHGLFRVRSFTQDDAHIFMTKEQITSEISEIIRLIHEVYQKFGFSYQIELSTRPENSMGSDADWEAAINGLQNALESLKLSYQIHEGDGAFYGPKIDFHLTDCLGRSWQCGTIQLDFQLPQQFDLHYVDENGERKRPIMLHRVCLGSIERFIGILIEHYAGRFPTWLAPIQVKVLAVSQQAKAYAKQVESILEEAGIRVEPEQRNEKLGHLIREAQYQKRIPYILIVGEKELEQNTVSVRYRDGGDRPESMALADFLAMLQTEIKNRS